MVALTACMAGRMTSRYFRAADYDHQRPAHRIMPLSGAPILFTFLPRAASGSGSHFDFAAILDAFEGHLWLRLLISAAMTRAREYVVLPASGRRRLADHRHASGTQDAAPECLLPRLMSACVSLARARL